MSIKLLPLFFSSFILLSMSPANACVSSNVSRPFTIRYWDPMALSYSSERGSLNLMPIRSIYAYLVPLETNATVSLVGDTKSDTLVEVSQKAIDEVSHRLIKDERSNAKLSSADSRKWMYFISNYSGKVELRFEDKSGFTYTQRIGVVYPKEKPVGEPIALDDLDGRHAEGFSVSARQNTLWLSLPGEVGDLWQLMGGQKTRFRIEQIIQLEVPSGDQPRVGLFLVAGSSVASGELSIIRGQKGWFSNPETTTFKVNARGVPAC